MSFGEDVGRAVRSGEELPIDAVNAWLRALVPSLDQSSLPKVTQFSGGASNWTYRLQYANADYVLRRPPAGTKAKSAHDMGREYRVQAALKTEFPVVPKMIGLCEDEAVIGAPFYVMERIAGIIPRKQMPIQMSPSTTRQLCVNVLDKLILLHNVDVAKAGLSTLGRGPGYPRRQIEGWTQRYDKARTWNAPAFAYVKSWLVEHTPMDVASSVIHNDFRFDNVVLDANDPTRVIGVLDWELATVGDPLMDLGAALAYWVEAKDDFVVRALRRQPTDLPGMMTRREVVEYYLDKRKLTVENWPFYEVYGLFRLAGIAQQIYYRYHHKQTKNPAFKYFWVMVNYFNWRCRRIIARGRS